MKKEVFAYGVTYVGIQPTLVRVECSRSDGLPGVDIAGIPAVQVKELRHRVRAAMRASGYEFPVERLVIDASPADAYKHACALDMALAVCVLQRAGVVPTDQVPNALFFGELGLDGVVRPVAGGVIAADVAAHQGYTLFCPPEVAAEASIVPGARIVSVRTLRDLVEALADQGNDARTYQRPAPLDEGRRQIAVDFANIKGLHAGKRAMEIAAAGGHNLVVIGPPGSGKTLLARAMIGILPPLTEEEKLEVARIHSVSGLGAGRAGGRSFRAPHPTASEAALVGGGNPTYPGEVSLAHHGVLLLDEAAEFRKMSLDAVRSALTERKVEVYRRHATVTLPADAHLIVASNPCPCGHYGDPRVACRCTPAQARAYLARLQPLLPVVDMCIELQPVTAQMLKEPAGESSATVAERVAAAREVQRKRGVINARMTPTDLEKFAPLSADCMRYLVRAAEALGAPANEWATFVRVARTIADLEGVNDITQAHLAEALAYRKGV